VLELLDDPFGNVVENDPRTAAATVADGGPVVPLEPVVPLGPVVPF
jgi:hypothetical protein